MTTQNSMYLRWSMLSLFVLIVLVAVGMWGCPQYKVYNQTMEGKAMLAHAQSSKEVAVAEARAKMESAVLLAASDTLRAWGVARSNQIIGNSLQGEEGQNYLKYLWINQLENNKNSVIYVPTETNLPILEATRHMRPQVAEESK